MVAQGEFPTRENCNPDDPEEFALWAFAALPGVNGAAFVMPIVFWRGVSAHLWALGFRHVEPPTLEYVPPQSTSPNWMTSPGSWVPAGTAPKPDGVTAARLVAEQMTAQQRAELREALEQLDQS